MYGLVRNNGNRLAKSIWDDDFFTDVFRGFDGAKIRDIPSRVTETEEGYSLEMEMPGITEEMVDISYEDETLLIKASCEEKNQDGGKVVYNSMIRRSYSKSFHIPGVDAAKAKATLKNGVLTLMLPKEESKKPKVIKIRAG